MISDVGAFSQSISIFRLSLLLSSTNGKRLFRNLALYLYKSFNRRKQTCPDLLHMPRCLHGLSLCGCLVLCILLVFCTWSLTPSMFVQSDAREMMCKLHYQLWNPPFNKGCDLIEYNISFVRSFVLCFSVSLVLLGRFNWSVSLPLAFCFSVCPSVCLPVCLSVCLCLSVSVALSLSLSLSHTQNHFREH